MTSISSLTSSTSASLYSSSQTDKPKSPYDVAASFLGMSTSDLTTELKSGKSLDDIATEKGLSTDDLASALAAGNPSNASSADKLSQAKQFASVDGVQAPPKGGHHHHSSTDSSTSSTSSPATSSTSSSDDSVLQELSSLLGTTSTTLTQQLTSGTSLSDLLQQSGVSLNSLASSVQQGLLYDQNL